MSSCKQHGQEFVNRLLPILQERNPERAYDFLVDNSSNQCLCSYLDCGCEEAVKVSLVCLSLTGRMENQATVARFLHHPDKATAGYAEHALWSIWFRAADPKSNAVLARAVRLVNLECLPEAVECLDRLIARRHDFAEAYNQRAIARYMLGDYELSARDCRRALRLTRYHFGAMSGLGHCHAMMGRLSDALKVYRRALLMYPHLEGIHDCIHHIRDYLRGTPAPQEWRSISA